MLGKLNIAATLILLVLSIVMVSIPLTASTSPIAKPGCQSRCGDFDIRYPFGMGSADCFYNEWFQVLCRNGRPHLRINQNGDESYELQDISYDYLNGNTLTIRSNTSTMRVCEDTFKLLGPNLTGTPFSYSGHNKFMLVGTGTAMFFGKDTHYDTRIEGGCTSPSDGRRVGSGVDRCYGLNCCQNYSFDTWWGGGVTEFKLNYSKSRTEKNSCASAFVVHRKWYPQNLSIFSDPSADLLHISVPLLLHWGIPKSMTGHGFQNNKYCRYRDEEWICHCPYGFDGNPYIVDGCQAPETASTSPLAKQGCQSRCGDIDIPYPFGMGSADCFYNEWFQVLCPNGRPHLRINQNGDEAYEALQMSRQYSRYATLLEIRSNTSNIRVCEDTIKLLGPNLTGTPFSYSYDNKFMLVGTGTATFFGKDSVNIGNSIKGGCASVSDGLRPWSGIYSCYGLNCCSVSDPSDFKEDYDTWSGYLTEFKFNYSKSRAEKNSCASAFLIDTDYRVGFIPKNLSIFTDPSADLVDISIPLSLTWRIPKSMTGDGFQNNINCGSMDEEWICECPCGSDGNPYIVDGCQDGNSGCSSPSTPSFEQRNFKSIVVGGIFSLMVTSYLLYKTIRRRINRKLKEKMFKRNGGLLLQKYLSSNQNIMEKVRLFTGKDLNKATDQFNDNRVLGHGGQGTVYKGMLADGKIVAVKKSKLLANANQVEEFINEIIILSQIDHRNVVKLLGCYLEMDVPILIYEYIPNGTLFIMITLTSH